MSGGFCCAVRVYYEDTDSGGVVYYANYLKFMERARTEWLRHLGFEQDCLAGQDGIIFAVRSVALDFLRPGRFNDLLYVSAALVQRRAASLTFAQEVWRAPPGAPVAQRSQSDSRGAGRIHENGKTVLCAGTVRVACVDAVLLRPRRIPRHLLTGMDRDS